MDRIFMDEYYEHLRADNIEAFSKERNDEYVGRAEEYKAAKSALLEGLGLEHLFDHSHELTPKEKEIWMLFDRVDVAELLARDMVSVDATIVADHIVLEAEDLGLSPCWLTYFDPEIIRNEFNIPSNLEPIAIIAVGYADTEKASPDRHSKDRKALESLVCYETF